MTEARWMLYAKKADFDRIAEQYHISPVTARIIRNRGLEDMEDIGRYLYGSVEQLHDPRLLPDMDRAVEILGEKASEGRRIRIVGDYDIDGVCSTYLLYRALKRIGAEVDYEIPDRIKDGYGINELIIEAAAEDGIDTILTCDNGIAAISQIARAKELGKMCIRDRPWVPGKMALLKLNFSAASLFARIIPPLGPLNVLWVVVVTTSA